VTAKPVPPCKELEKWNFGEKGLLGIAFAHMLEESVHAVPADNAPVGFPAGIAVRGQITYLQGRVEENTPNGVNLNRDPVGRTLQEYRCGLKGSHLLI